MKIADLSLSGINKIISPRLSQLKKEGQIWKFSYIVQIPWFIVDGKRETLLIKNKWYKDNENKNVFGYIGGGVKSQALQDRFCKQTGAQAQRKDDDLRFIIRKQYDSSSISETIKELIDQCCTKEITRSSLQEEIYEEIVEENLILDQNDIELFQISKEHYFSLERANSKKSDHTKLLMMSFIPIRITGNGMGIIKKMSAHKNIHYIEDSSKTIQKTDPNSCTSFLYRDRQHTSICLDYPVDLSNSFSG